MQLLPLGWFIATVVLVWLVELLLRKTAPSFSDRSLAWKNLAVRLPIALITGLLVIWLFDVPGLMQQMQYVQMGDYESAKSAHNPVISW